ncbi:MAG: TonB-dependent receptor [Candidatus Pseudobacter hemicellulosilyticus]|uniref:TonB-dependent receptor n=1 Tax=Candidatus Pseudobacter hemicellulosilyticus TaxID=3121375 RepID=A0AAJ5WQ00_9BACT|nr:MAG: TonB-dependent receptor [Pseudobacter sp.]
MRNKFLTTTLSFLLGLAMAQAQQPGKVSGRITDQQHSALSGATVTVLKAADSAAAGAGPTDATGNYTIGNLAPGKYLLLASAVGFRKSYSAPFELSSAKPSAYIPAIALAAGSDELQSVTVTASRPLIEQKIDRTVLNVEASVTNTGANALEVLEKAPGVQVDKDGNISLKGKQGVTILIDGRPSYLSGADLANMLRGMQASQLDQVEIMTNPPAKYDAAGNSGIINIRLKKNKLKGFNGNLSLGAGQGFYFKTNESLSLNYRNGKVNLFSSYSFGRNNNYNEIILHRRYRNEDGSTRAIFDQVALMRRRQQNNNLKLGMDYFLTSKTTIGIVFSGYYNPQKNRADNTSYLQDPNGKVDSIVVSENEQQERYANTSVNLNLRHQFDTTGRELNLDLDYIRYANTNEQYFSNRIYDPSWKAKMTELLYGDMPSDISIASAKLDYTHPFSKKTKLETGLKSSAASNDSKARYYTGDGTSHTNTNWAPDYTKTNFFDYKEQINAAYVSLNHKLNEKWGVQAGLRYENTHYKGLQYGNPQKNDSAFSRSYNSWFPTVYLSYNLSKTHQFGANFGRRIDRPGYHDLNPFLFFVDKYTYGSGNPYLRPQYSNNLELTHIFKGMLTTTLNYSITKDLFNEIFEQEELPNGEKGYATIIREGNIGKRQNAGISMNLQLKPAKWFSSNFYINYNYTKYTGRMYNEYIDVEAGNLFFNLNNQFKFGKVWSAELSGWFRSKGLDGQIMVEPMGRMDAGVARQILKEKGSLKLNIRDILYTQIPKGYMSFEQTDASFKSPRDSRVVNLTFTYRFGKPLKNGNSQRQRNVEETNRVKSGE